MVHKASRAFPAIHNLQLPPTRNPTKNRRCPYCFFRKSIYYVYIQYKQIGLAVDSESPLYERILKDIRAKIEQGIYRAGEKIDSLNQLCARYGVSKITAIRAIDELEKRGLLRKVAGRGSFVTGIRYVEPEPEPFPELKRIVLFSKGFIENTADSSFARRIYNSIRDCAGELGIDLRVEHISENEVGGQVMIPFMPTPEEGIIALARDSVVSMLYLFTNPNCRRVLVDTSMAGVPDVLSDNYYGIRKMLEYLAGLGHRRILFAARFADGQNFVNENERLEAFFNLATAMQLQPEAVDSGKFQDILAALRRSDRPSAVMFSRDDPAMKLLGELEAAGWRIPDDLSVVGFDDYLSAEYDSTRLTTFRVDTVGLGRAAVERLRRPVDPLWLAPLHVRIRGELMIRETAGSVCRASGKQKKTSKTRV